MPIVCARGCACLCTERCVLSVYLFGQLLQIVLELFDLGPQAVVPVQRRLEALLCVGEPGVVRAARRHVHQLRLGDRIGKI